MSFGVLAGGSFPVGEWSRAVYDPGYHVGALAELRLPGRWVALRIDGTYQRLGMGRVALPSDRGAPSGRVAVSTGRVLSGLAGTVFRLPGLRTRVRPYALAAVGLSRLRVERRIEGGATPADASEVVSGAAAPNWELGAAAGVGADLRVGRATFFAEGRYQRARSYLDLVPLSVGVRVR